MMDTKQLTGTSLVGDSVNRERVENDYYATPKESTISLLENLNLSDCKTFYEPACGEGYISKVLEKWFGAGTYFANIHSTDLIDRGYGVGGIDFLKVDNSKKFDCVITNPPFKLAKEFIEKGLKLSNKYVIMFAKIQLLESTDREKLFKQNPPKYIYVFVDRQNPLRNGNPFDENGKKWCSTMCFAWFVWEVGFKGDPIVRWLNTRKW